MIILQIAVQFTYSVALEDTPAHMCAFYDLQSIGLVPMPGKIESKLQCSFRLCSCFRMSGPDQMQQRVLPFGCVHLRNALLLVQMHASIQSPFIQLL